MAEHIALKHWGTLARPPSPKFPDSVRLEILRETPSPLKRGPSNTMFPSERTLVFKTSHCSITITPKCTRSLRQLFLERFAHQPTCLLFHSIFDNT